MSEQQLDDYISHVLAMFLIWTLEENSTQSAAWRMTSEAQRMLWALARANEFLGLYNEARLAVEKEIA